MSTAVLETPAPTLSPATRVALNMLRESAGNHDAARDEAERMAHACQDDGDTRGAGFYRSVATRIAALATRAES